jgi:hypothetical protein
VSLITIVLFAGGYLAVVALALSLFACAKRADQRAQREHEALVRSMTGRFSRQASGREDSVRDLVSHHRTG